MQRKRIGHVSFLFLFYFKETKDKKKKYITSRTFRVVCGSKHPLAALNIPRNLEAWKSNNADGRGE